MSKLSKMLMKPLALMTGNLLMQRALRKVVKESHYLMGIGTGNDVSSSGEHAILSRLKENSPAPYTIFDVGANAGQFFSLVRRCLSSSEYTIHCFEPGKTTFETLKANVKPEAGIILNNFGLGKTKGHFSLYYDNPGSGLASLTQRRLDHLNIDFSPSETVQIETLDDYCDEHGVERIDLLKIDVEGHELDALTGASRKFEQNRIGIVTIEFGGCNLDTGTYFRDFFDFFCDQKMTLYRITPSGYLSPIRKYDERDEQFVTSNYLAIRM